MPSVRSRLVSANSSSNFFRLASPLSAVSWWITTSGLAVVIDPAAPTPGSSPSIRTGSAPASRVAAGRRGCGWCRTRRGRPRPASGSRLLPRAPVAPASRILMSSSFRRPLRRDTARSCDNQRVVRWGRDRPGHRPRLAAPPDVLDRLPDAGQRRGGRGRRAGRVPAHARLARGGRGARGRPTRSRRPSPAGSRSTRCGRPGTAASGTSAPGCPSRCLDAGAADPAERVEMQETRVDGVPGAAGDGSAHWSARSSCCARRSATTTPTSPRSSTRARPTAARSSPVPASASRRSGRASSRRPSGTAS